MVTPTLSPSRPKNPLRKALIVVAVALAVAMLFGIGGGLWFYSAMRAALPQVDGKLQVAGLTAPVTVVRDAQGVPHLRAANLEDLFFAQGYVTAQDRLWQMDMTRRFAAGELAEIGGPEFLKRDTQQRILGLKATAERALQDLNLADLEAYARGVNAFIESHRDRLPIEFRVMRYQPRPWTPADSAVIVAHMAQELNLGQAYEELWREKVTARVGPELAAELYVNSSWRDHPPGQDGGELKAEPGRTARITGAHRHGKNTMVWPAPSLEAANADFLAGSNNWVVS